MQDRFKLKFWNKTDKELVEVINIDYNSGFVDYVTKDGFTSTQIKYGELIQCTGLKDKNNTLIFEGDIIYKKGTKNHKGEKMYSEVIWDQMYAEFNISDDNGMHRMPSNSNNIEIVGNIYENPELLEDY